MEGIYMADDFIAEVFLNNEENLEFVV